MAVLASDATAPPAAAPASALFRNFCAFLVFAFPVTIVVADRVASALFFILAIVGLALLFRRDRAPLPRDVKLVMFGIVLLVAFAALIFVAVDGSESGLKRLVRYGRFLLIIPIFVALRRAQPAPFALWLGISVGALLTGLVAVDQVITHTVYEPTSRADGSTHAIIFGNIALLMAAISLGAIDEFRRRHRALVIVPVLAACAGAMASFLSGSRGGWLAIPALFAMLVWHHRRALKPAQVLAVGAGFAVVLSAVYLIPQTGVKQRIDAARSEISAHAEQGEANTSVGARLEMWKAAWLVFTEHPWTGVGMGGFKTEKQALIDQGRISPAVGQYHHPHNEYLGALVTRGIGGLFTLLLMFGLALKVFWDIYRDEPQRRVLGFAGLLVVVGFIHFALSGDTFDRSVSITFFTFMIAAFTAPVVTPDATRATRIKTLSATIITRNEADRIEPCLQSLHGWADEIIVLDAQSTDATVDIARRYATHVEVTDWPGFGPQKQRALERATGEWVLSIDADERVTPELRAEIDALLSREPDAVGYRIPWQVLSHGRTLDFGRSGRAPLRLFRRDGASFSAAQVHEHVILPAGKIGRLRARLIHDSHRDFHHALEKFGKYAWLWACERHARGRRDNVWNALAHGVWMFIAIYFFRLGLLDGRRGLVMAILFAQYTFNKHAALWTLSARAKTIASTPESKP